MSKVYFGLSLLLLSSCAQALLITAKTNKTIDDTVIIRSFNVITEELKFSDTLVLRPGTVNHYHYDIQEAMTLVIDNVEYLVSKEDSINLVQDSLEGFYRISGGKFPGNYSLLNTIKYVNVPYTSYDKSTDNYYEYIHGLDSVFERRNDILKRMLSTKLISQDIYKYLISFIKYAHIYSILYVGPSPILLKSYPRTLSNFYPEILLNDFFRDDLCDMPIYVLASCSYIIFNAKKKDLSRFKYLALDYAFERLNGRTQRMTALTLFVNYNFSKSLHNDTLNSIYNRIKLLDLSQPQLYSTRTVYIKSLFEGKQIDSSILHTTWLMNYQGKKISLYELLENFRGYHVMLDFWASWCSPCLEIIPLVKRMKTEYNKNSDLVVLYISVDTDLFKWKRAAEKHSITENQYLLTGDFTSPISTYVVLKEIPRFIMIGSTGVIESIDFQLYPGLLNLTN